MIDGLSVFAIFVMVVACLLGLRATQPVPVIRPVVQDEPRQIVSVVRPLAIAEEPVHVFQPPAPVAYTDETVKLTPSVLSFLETLE